MVSSPRSVLRSNHGRQWRPMTTPHLRRAVRVVRRVRAVKEQRRRKARPIGNAVTHQYWQINFTSAKTSILPVVFIFCRTRLFSPLSILGCIDIQYSTVWLFWSVTGMQTLIQSTPWWFMKMKAKQERAIRLEVMGIRPCWCRGWVIGTYCIMMLEMHCDLKEDVKHDCKATRQLLWVFFIAWCYVFTYTWQMKTISLYKLQVL